MFYSDGACEFVSAASQLAIPHYPGEPGRSTTHARAERKIRTLKDSIRALVLQAGLPAVRWSWAVHAASVALNLLWTHPDGVSAYAKRFAMPAKAHWRTGSPHLARCFTLCRRALARKRFTPCNHSVLPAGRVGSAIRALPLDVFIRSGGKSPSSLWITRDWKPCCSLVFPLRDYTPARTAALNLQEETYEVAPLAAKLNCLATMKGFILEASDEPATDARESAWQEMFKNLPPPSATHAVSSGEGRTERSECVMIDPLRGDVRGDVPCETVEDRPYPTWDDRSVIAPPPNDTTRRLEYIRYDRMLGGVVQKVKKDSRRPPVAQFRFLGFVAIEE
eukprot:6472207-Amphidinium_carterae.5